MTKQGVWFWLSPLGPLVCSVLGLSVQSALKRTLYLDHNPPYYFQLLFAKEIISLKAQVVDGLGLY